MAVCSARSLPAAPWSQAALRGRNRQPQTTLRPRARCQSPGDDLQLLPQYPDCALPRTPVLAPRGRIPEGAQLLSEPLAGLSTTPSGRATFMGPRARWGAPSPSFSLPCLEASPCLSPILILCLRDQGCSLTLHVWSPSVFGAARSVGLGVSLHQVCLPWTISAETRSGPPDSAPFRTICQHEL